MKKILSLVLMLICLFSISSAEETTVELVSQMDYVLELPDVIRKGTYSGETLSGIPHGFGVFETTNSNGINWHYIGQWENGKMSGDGGQYWDNGREEIGEFKQNDLICGFVREGTGQCVWANSEPNDHGHYEAKEYREDGSLRLECCIDPDSGMYHKGTIYTKDGQIFFSGEFGEGFDWNKLYIQ